MKRVNYTNTIYLDTESLGLSGPAKLIQYSIGRHTKIEMFRPDKEPDKLEEFRKIIDNRYTLLVIYNAPFDMAKLYQLFGTEKRLLCDVLDLANHAKLKHPLGKYSFQRSGERAIAKLKDIPMIIAENLAEYVLKKLKRRIHKLIEVKAHFHTTKRKGFKDITFTLEANLRLKTLMQYYGLKIQNIKDVWPIPERGEEDLHNPFFQECHKRLEPICDDILDNKHKDSKNFYKYAEDDIKYLWVLDENLDFPELDHNDYVSHIVGYTKIRGFKLDKDIIQNFIDETNKKIEEASDLPFNVKSSKQKLEYFGKKYPKLKLKNCDKTVLKKLAELGDKEAQKIQDLGSLKQQLDQALKLIATNDLRAHPDFRVIGTATQRMAGSGGFNYQAIGKDSPIRKAILCDLAGDFSSLEVGLAATIYDDKKLKYNLDKKLDMHLALGVKVIPYLKQYSYEEAKKIKDEAEELPAHKQTDKHKKLMKARKQAKFLMFTSIYGGTERAVTDLLGVTEEEATMLLEAFNKEYKDMHEFKKNMELDYCTGDTENWTKDSVSKMKDYCEDWFGYKRSFNFEAEIADLFWKLAFNDDRGFKNIFAGLEDFKVTRKASKGEQTLINSVKSAFLGAALTIQKSVARSATNSIIQSVGAQLTKKLMQRIWETVGKKYGISILNIHDELVLSGDKGNINYYEETKKVVQEFIKEQNERFPYLAMDFKESECWADR